MRTLGKNNKQTLALQVLCCNLLAHVLIVACTRAKLRTLH